MKWTRAQMADARYFEPGMVVTFHRSTGGYLAGDAVTVKRIEPLWEMKATEPRRKLSASSAIPKVASTITIRAGPMPPVTGANARAINGSSGKNRKPSCPAGA